jgi:hypothetical protein
VTRCCRQRSKPAALRDASLLNHLVGGGQQRFRDAKAEGLGGFDVDDELELRRLLDRQVGGLGSFENARDIARRQAKPS